MNPGLPESSALALAHRNVRFGWWSLLVFLSLGMVLEAMHGFKIGWYLDVVNEGRRLQWTLAHTHGTLISLVNIAFGLTLRAWPDAIGPRGPLASSCLIWAGMLMPAGFFFGGAFSYGPDPGFAIALVPIGGVLLFCAVLFAAMLTRNAGATVSTASQPEPTDEPPSKKSKKHKSK